MVLVVLRIAFRTHGHLVGPAEHLLQPVVVPAEATEGSRIR